jgi:hypothetical protein
MADQDNPDEVKRAQLALAGNVKALSKLADQDPSAAYRWLLVASDAGFEQADDCLGDLEEHVDEFRYDDDGVGRGLIKLEVAYLYFRGTLVPLDVERGLTYLHEYLAVAMGGILDWNPSMLDWLVEGVPDTSRQAIAATLEALPFVKVSIRLERVRQLWKLKAPAKVLKYEVDALQAAVDEVRAFLKLA